MWWIALIVVIAAAAAWAATPLFRPRERWDLGDTTELDRLFEEKARVLRALKDLDHELEAGMLGAKDHAEARAEWMDRAVSLNRRIEALTGVSARGDAPGAGT
ncbi:MAG: hypothetical protein HMLKMBBP_01715 [Planctomycetes bacterium]|nr:hypothetical protein [Planctomycetota bacterium]